MKAIKALLALAVFAAFPVFAQNESQAPRAFEVAEVVLPDIPPHMVGREFFVARQGQFGWTKTKEDGDTQLLVSEVFSKDESSGETVAGKLYPLDDTKPCAVFFTNENGVRVLALILENGKAVMTKSGMVHFETILNQEGGIAGIRIFLYSLDDPDKKSLAERKFMIVK